MNPEYLHVLFRAQMPESVITTSFGVITACNPDGKNQTDGDNQIATESLQRALQEEGLVHFPVIGGSPDFTHQEAGFGVIWNSSNEAVAWGRKFQQEAIFWVEKGIVYLISCAGQNSLRVGKWDDLCDA
ncbi:MAG: DUF3293 domain-containing protein [Akkermansiaceae bacterium]